MRVYASEATRRDKGDANCPVHLHDFMTYPNFGT
jgi:hypothetical protein